MIMITTNRAARGPGRGPKGRNEMLNGLFHSYNRIDENTERVVAKN